MAGRDEVRQNTVQSVDRALELINALSSAGKSCSIKTLCSLTGLNKATVHRLLQTLIRHNYVRQNETNGEYSLGYKILSISAKMINNIDIHNVARPYLQNICDETGQAVNLSVLQGNDAIFIDRVENPDQIIRMYSQVGRAIPVYCSASGKVLIAWQNKQKLENTISTIEYKKITAGTITDKEELRRELKEVREKGYATDWFEHEDAVFCFASPVFNHTNEVIAAISIAGVMLQQTEESVYHYIEVVTNYARALSRELGCVSPPTAFNADFARQDAEHLFGIASHNKR